MTLEHVYMTDLIQAEPNKDLDDAGSPWGFNYFAELLIINEGDVEAAATAMDEAAKRSPAKWERVNPYPHVRISVSVYLDLMRAGIVKVTQEEAEEIRRSWQ